MHHLVPANKIEGVMRFLTNDAFHAAQEISIINIGTYIAKTATRNLSN